MLYCSDCVFILERPNALLHYYTCTTIVRFHASTSGIANNSRNLEERPDHRKARPCHHPTLLSFVQTQKRCTMKWPIPVKSMGLSEISRVTRQVWGISPETYPRGHTCWVWVLLVTIPLNVYVRRRLLNNVRLFYITAVKSKTGDKSRGRVLL